MDWVWGIVVLLVFVSVIFLICALLWDILSLLWNAVHNLSPRLKASISVFLAIGGIWFTYYVAKRSLPDLSKIEKVQERIISRQDSIMSLQDSIGQVLSRGHNVIVKNVQILQHDQQKALLKIESLDTCIDKHFEVVNARLHYIDGHLREITPGLIGSLKGK